LGSRKGIRPVKTEWWGVVVIICLEQGADLHTAQLIPLPLTVSCSSKIQIGFTFLLPAYPGSPDKRAVKRVCVCVCVLCLDIERLMSALTVADDIMAAASTSLSKVLNFLHSCGQFIESLVGVSVCMYVTLGNCLT